ncbi:MAG: SH3 domain-containing protein [Dehalococcoidia bacterium]
MTRSTFRMLALLVVLAALSLTLVRSEGASAQTASASQNYGAIARTALAAVNQQRGECFLWVRAVVQAAVGRTIGYDYHAGYLQAGGIEVPLATARDGDLIQIANPASTSANVDYPGLHTAIVLDNLGGGKFRVIDSNMNFDGIVHIREDYVPTEIAARYPGLVVRVYRIEGTPAPVSPITVAPAPRPAITTVPAPGAAVSVAADGDCLRVRSAPGLSGTVLGCLPTGAGARVTQSGPEVDGYHWVQVSSGGLTGWVAAEYLAAASSNSAAPAPSSATITVAVAAPVRAGFATPPVFNATNGQAAAVFLGGTVDELIAAAADAKATGVWVQDSGGAFQLVIVGAPAFMLDAFRAKFASPFSVPVAVTLMGATS